MELERYDDPLVIDPNAVEDNSAKPITLIETAGKRSVVGYAVVWGAISSLRRDGTQHVYERGSLTWSPDTLALWHHQTSTPLAGLRNGTLRLAEDEVGVLATIDLDDTSDGVDAYKRVVSRLICGMSFAVDPRSVQSKLTSNPQVKQITKAFAYEVTLTATPAMTATNVVAGTDSKNLTAQMKEQKAREQKNRLNQVRLSLLRPR